jgi:hypothetical protein
MNALQKMSIYLKMSLKTLMHKPSFESFKGMIIYFPIWWKSLVPEKNSVSDSRPWIAFGALDFIKKIIKPGMSVFEYGSGGSTLFWSTHVKKLF